MATTTRQLSKIAGVSEQTVRNYTREFGPLLSPAARGEGGTRLFDDQDVQTFCAVVDLRRENVPQAEIIERLQRGDIYIDAVGHTTPQQEATSQTQATQTALLSQEVLMMVRSDLQRQINALRRTQTILLRGAVLWGVVLGAIGAMVAGGFVLWLLWLLAGMQ